MQQQGPMYDTTNYWQAIPQSLQYMQPGTPVQFPQTSAPPISYGPTHTALSDALRAALLNQMQMPGLLAPPNPQAMGVLSPQITPTQAVVLPSRGDFNPPLGPNQYGRIGYDTYKDIPVQLDSKKKKGSGDTFWDKVVHVSTAGLL